MTTTIAAPPAKIGRPLTGDTPMTSAERVRRTRERQRASGAKGFTLQVQGVHLQYVELLAASVDTSTSAALRQLLEAALDRYVGVMRRCERMKENGATDDEIESFMHTHFMPELPPMPEKNGQ